MQNMRVNIYMRIDRSAYSRMPVMSGAVSKSSRGSRGTLRVLTLHRVRDIKIIMKNFDNNFYLLKGRVYIFQKATN